MARPQADQALVASDQARAGLGPSGFDPSRCAFLGRQVETRKAAVVAYAFSADRLDELVDAWTPYGMTCEFTVVPRDFVEAGEDWFQRTIDKAAHLTWVRKERLAAIATEARRAESND